MKLLDRQITALKEAILKWEGIINDNQIDKGTKNCPLCIEFYNEGEGDCKNCPIALKVEDTFCDSTPYEKFNNHYITMHLKYINNTNPRIVCEDCEILAREELMFLTTLLKEYEEKTLLIQEMENNLDGKLSDFIFWEKSNKEDYWLIDGSCFSEDKEIVVDLKRFNMKRINDELYLTLKEEGE